MISKGNRKKEIIEYNNTNNIIEIDSDNYFVYKNRNELFFICKIKFKIYVIFIISVIFTFNFKTDKIYFNQTLLFLYFFI